MVLPGTKKPYPHLNLKEQHKVFEDAGFQITRAEKAQSKYDEDNTQFKRLSPMIKAMYIAKALISDEINKRE